MKLRVRSSRGVSDVSVDPSATVASLKKQLGATALRCGFPPKLLSVDDSQRLSAVLSSGDVIVVQSQQPQSQQPQSQQPQSQQPQSLQPQPTPKASTTSASAIPASSILSNGTIVIREVPDDNSCLFRSVNALLSRSNQPPESLRTIVKDAVAAQPELYSEAFLGRSNAQYQQWIMDANSWGGAIELSALAHHFRIELAAFDIKTMRLDRYGEGKQFSSVAYLVYDGIHYNYMALAIGDLHVTQFDVKEQLVEEHMRKQAQKLHDERRYTDTANASFKCAQCGKVLQGEKAVAAHAQQSGHSEFSES
ncbi:Ubiquitin thioesterase OTU1 [Gracilariopsis chorda]|uniref:Ubiquitin thioesterase OTU n=1 Tax=Gracilariopsis chorda TaxID=448386 RepID=A0A2V3IK19_9FLOR|nr:Ubiquitin thioesterase OTU1 [Gracilariopsis chorda]|eukprot:PXF42411.1 Ubiquitin thioesterase OTU1 [Gracilariopsis chorda]